MVFRVRVSSILGSYLVFLDLFHVCTCVCVCVRACAQWYLTLCDSMNCSPPGSSLHDIFQARILKQGILYPRTSSWPGDWTHIFVSPRHWQANSLHWATWEAPLVCFSPLNVSHINITLSPAIEPRKIEDNFFFLLNDYFFYSHGMIMFKCLVSCHYEHSFLSCFFSLYMNSHVPYLV